MPEFRRISECDNPMEVLGAPMEVSLMPEQVGWPYRWSSSHGRELNAGDEIEVFVNLALEEANDRTQSEYDALMGWFTGLIGRTVLRLPDKSKHRDLREITSILQFSSVGVSLADVAEKIKRKLEHHYSCSFSVDVIKISGSRGDKLLYGDGVDIGVRITSKRASKFVKEGIRNLNELLSNSSLQLPKHAGVVTLTSIAAGPAVGMRPCDLAHLMRTRLSKKFKCGFIVEVDRLSDLADEVRQPSNEARENELYDRFCAALRQILPANPRGPVYLNAKDLDDRLGEKSWDDRHAAWRAVRAIYPGADCVSAMLAFEESLLVKMECSPEARRKFAYLGHALDEGYRPLQSIERLLEDGEGSVIPAHFATAMGERARSDGNPDIQAKLPRENKGGKLRCKDTAKETGKRASRRSLNAWPELLFHTVSGDIEHEVRASFDARARRLVPPREIYLRFEELAFRQFNRAYDQVRIWERTPFQTTSHFQSEKTKFSGSVSLIVD